MIDLGTDYLGLRLANPLVPSASPLSRELDMARRLEDAGAAALVMHSLFEEELLHEEQAAARFLLEQDIGHAEADSYLPEPARYASALDAYLEQLAALKANLDIPVVASLNGASPGGWLHHARELEQAGADALELNAYYVAADPAVSGAAIEQRYVDLLGALKAELGIPVAVKLSSQFSSVGHLVVRLEGAGADGVALFNRFYQPDLDLETLRVVPRLELSSPAEALLRIRWVALLYGKVKLSLAVTGGIHSATEALKALLAGADVTHLCSALLQGGPQRLGQVLEDMRRWLEEHEYASLAQLRGSVSHERSLDAAAYERANYLQVLDSWTPPRGVWR